MTTFYIDTSAIVKRYKTEEGTKFMDRLFEIIKSPEQRATTSFLAVLEFVSTGRRLLKAKDITEEEFKNMVARFLKDVEEYFVIRSIEDKIISSAIRKVIAHGLKTADSIHLATALEIKNILKDVKERVVFIADDEELCKAATEEGLDVINPRKENAIERVNEFVKS